VNTSNISCSSLTLKCRRISVFPFHAAVEESRRTKNLIDFCTSDSQDSVMICTDRAGRGLDFKGRRVST
jgi:superfamily II DNA/RNA helicase